jgi:hypothetical protein
LQGLCRPAHGADVLWVAVGFVIGLVLAGIVSGPLAAVIAIAREARGSARAG